MSPLRIEFHHPTEPSTPAAPAPGVAETPLSEHRLPRASFLRAGRHDAARARALLASLARMVRRVDRSLAK